VLGINTVPVTAAGDYYNVNVLKTYSWLVTRDTAIAFDNYPAGFANDFILNMYNIIKSKTTIEGDLAYQVPDGLVLSTLAVANLHAYGAALDGNFYLINIAYNYWKKSGLNSFATSELAFLKLLADHATRDTDGLIIVPSGGSILVSWGFFDGVNLTGKSLFVNVLAYNAYKELAEMALAIEDTATYNDCISKRDQLKTSINATFYVHDNVGGVDRYWMKASTGVCSGQFDLPGTCFAIYSGVVDAGKIVLISNYIVSIIDQCTYDGGIIWVPDSHQYNYGTTCWESGGGVYGYNSYQNGGYWATGLNWFLYVVNSINPTLASSIFRLAYYRMEKKNFQEWWNKSTGTGVLNYSTSQTALSDCKSFIQTEIL
jgi:hypothetical protein